MREQILTLLERNSRMTAEEIAVLLGSSREMVEEEIRKMEEQRIICGYNTLINWEQADADKVTGLIEVRVSPQRGKGFDHIAERIYNYPEVKSVYLISGGRAVKTEVETEYKTAARAVIAGGLQEDSEVIREADAEGVFDGAKIRVHR